MQKLWTQHWSIIITTFSFQEVWRSEVQITVQVQIFLLKYDNDNINHILYKCVLLKKEGTTHMKYIKKTEKWLVMENTLISIGLQKITK